MPNSSTAWAFHHIAGGTGGQRVTSLTRRSGVGYGLRNNTITWEEGMTKIARILFAAAAVGALSVSAQAADTIKIGLILPYSGQFADGAAQQDNAVKLYMKQHGDTVAGKKIEIIRKDTGGINPAVAKRLAEELITRDNVDIITGFLLTPNAMAGGDVSSQAKKFMVVMNAATAIITTKSPYMARTSLTIPQ